MTYAECQALQSEITEATSLRTDKISVRDDHIYQAAGLTTEIQQLTTLIQAKQMQFNQGCVPMPPP